MSTDQTNPKQAVIDILLRVNDDASVDELRDCLAPALNLKGVKLYEGVKHISIFMLSVVAILLATGSFYFVTINQSIAIITYGFWAIAPSAWFFLERAYLFDTEGDQERIALFKYSQELAQKFWAGLLVGLGITILTVHGISV
ncbi:MAG: hypothetical protein AAGI37_05780 [Planctomycetota bacterium]